MVEILKLVEVPSIIALLVVIFLLIGVINKLLTIVNTNGKNLQELTTWLKTRFSIRDDR